MSSAAIMRGGRQLLLKQLSNNNPRLKKQALPLLFNNNRRCAAAAANSSSICFPLLRSISSSTTPVFFSSAAAVRDYAGGGELADRCDANVVASPFPAIPSESWNSQPLPEFVMSDWKKRSDELAILDGSTGMRRTFGDYYEDTRGIAGSLKHDLGVDETGCVCLFAPNHVDYVPVTLAVGLCGAKLTPVNPLYKRDELRTVLERSRSSVLIAHECNLDIAFDAAGDVESVRHVLVMTTDDGRLATTETATKNYPADDLDTIKRHSRGFDETTDAVVSAHPYLLPYSSGTTGTPKGVSLTHGNLVVNLLQMDECERPDMKDGAALFSPLPFFHIYGMTASVLYSAWNGNPLLTMSGRFDFEMMLDMIEKHRPAVAHLVPPILLALAKSPLVDDRDLSSLKSILSAAAPLGPDTEAAVRDRLGCLVKQAWGMSELSPLGTINSSTNAKQGSIGPLVSNTLGKVLDEKGNSLGPNETGELAIKGPQVMTGYMEDLDKTRECLSESGWLRTGDMAHYDDDGFFFITDRIKELIKTRGFQVAPAELEELMLGHDDVADVAVIGVPDERSGELPLASVVLKQRDDNDNDGDRDEELMKEGIYEWVKERVAPHKRLDGGIVFADSIPKSASGKILRRLLRDEHAADQTK